MQVSDNYVGFDEVVHGFYRFYMDKDDDKRTTVFVKFMEETHNMGIIDLEKISTIALVNRVMHMVLQRKLSFEEKFKLTLTQAWDNDCTNIRSDDDLFSVWSLYNHYSYYEIHLDLEIISKPTTSSARKSLFQQPLINATTENISPENPTAINLDVPVNEAQTSDILMKLVPLDQLHTQPSPIHSNASLYEDFVNTFEKSPTSHLTNSNATQQVHIEEGDNEDSNLRLCFPSDQQQQTFNSSDSDDSMYNMFDSDDEFQQNTEQSQLHVQVTDPNIGESDDDVDDCLLSDYESDNNEFVHVLMKMVIK
ncbi:hypothetical protein AB3S75_001063 [Citrus x aurantiifolia]